MTRSEPSNYVLEPSDQLSQAYIGQRNILKIKEDRQVHASFLYGSYEKIEGKRILLSDLIIGICTQVSMKDNEPKYQTADHHGVIKWVMNIKERIRSLLTRTVTKLPMFMCFYFSVTPF